MGVAALRRILTLAGMVAVMAAVSAFVVSPAYAWDLAKSTNGVVVERDPSLDATAQVYVNVYYGYKGGDVWSGAYQPRLTSSYNSFVQYPGMFGSAGTTPNIAEIPLVAGGGRCQMVYVGSGYAIFPVLCEPLDVAVVNTATVDVRQMPSVGTVSIDGTLPVSVPATTTVGVSSVGSVDSFGLSWAIAFASLVGGVAVGQWVRARRW